MHDPVPKTGSWLQSIVQSHFNYYAVPGNLKSLVVFRDRVLALCNDVIVDHTWIWRADHGKGVGWNSNTSANGLVVNGDQVTIYGLFVEHHQQFQVLWNGNGGRTYFYQSEIPYDPPNQASYSSTAEVNGWASYKLADAVTRHEAWGLGIYSVFIQPNVNLSRAIEVPKKPEVRFHHMITVALGNHGEISNVIDNIGGPTSIQPRFTPKVRSFPERTRESSSPAAKLQMVAYSCKLSHDLHCAIGLKCAKVRRSKQIIGQGCANFLSFLLELAEILLRLFPSFPGHVQNSVVL